MTHNEKIDFMKVAAGICSYGFVNKDLDMLVSLYDLILKKKGQTDLKDIVTVRYDVEEREKARVEAKMIQEIFKPNTTLK